MRATGQRLPCLGDPNFVGHAGDDGGFFRYPAGRGAEHINAGTFVLAIDDTSTVQNFHLTRPDLGRHAPRPTDHCEPGRARSAGP